MWGFPCSVTAMVARQASQHHWAPPRYRNMSPLRRWSRQTNTNTIVWLALPPGASRSSWPDTALKLSVRLRIMQITTCCRAESYTEQVSRADSLAATCYKEDSLATRCCRAGSRAEICCRADSDSFLTRCCRANSLATTCCRADSLPKGFYSVGSLATTCCRAEWHAATSLQSRLFLQQTHLPQDVAEQPHLLYHVAKQTLVPQDAAEHICL